MIIQSIKSEPDLDEISFTSVRSAGHTNHAGQTQELGERDCQGLKVKTPGKGLVFQGLHRGIVDRKLRMEIEGNSINPDHMGILFIHYHNVVCQVFF